MIKQKDSFTGETVSHASLRSSQSVIDGHGGTEKFINEISLQLRNGKAFLKDSKDYFLALAQTKLNSGGSWTTYIAFIFSILNSIEMQLILASKQLSIIRIVFKE